MHRRRINKKFLAVLGIVFALRPVFSAGQSSGDPFSALDKAFYEVEYTPTPEDEYYIGRAVSANILSVYEPYTEKPALTNYVNLICQALVINSSRPPVYNGYHVTILNSTEFNAFATPGGHIFITRGLVEAVASEDELAGIIAHELSHVMLKHGMKMIDDMKIDEEINAMARQAAGFSGNSGQQRIVVFRDSVSGLFYAMAKNGYSVPQEFEADIAAVDLLAAAGYTPTSFIDLLRLFQRNEPLWDEGFGTTHPNPAQRIANVERKAKSYRVADTRSHRKARFERTVKN